MENFEQRFINLVIAESRDAQRRGHVEEPVDPISKSKNFLNRVGKREMGVKSYEL